MSRNRPGGLGFARISPGALHRGSAEGGAVGAVDHVPRTHTHAPGKLSELDPGRITTDQLRRHGRKAHQRTHEGTNRAFSPVNKGQTSH